MERWPSGLRRTLGKCVYCQRYRGFESHSLRHICGQKLHFFEKKHKLEKKTKKHQISIDLQCLLTIKDFIDFIKKFKNVINNFPKKK